MFLEIYSQKFLKFWTNKNIFRPKIFLSKNLKNLKYLHPITASDESNGVDGEYEMSIFHSGFFNNI